MSDTVQKIKNKLTIVDVVAPYVKLTKAGRYHKGLSPFNKEKSPSFFVNPERGSYYCFSSGQGGDMFTFIEKMEGVDFKGALKMLAEKAGVELVYEKATDRSKLDRFREVIARAESIFARGLGVGSEAYAYALSRGLTPETIRTWNIGFAQNEWRTLFEELSLAGFTTEEMLGAGLIKEAEGKVGTYYDRFRNRLMFPIRDIAGRTVAFTGRALEKDAEANHHTNTASNVNVGVVAKYLNSPETELFKKSEILFGLDRAKDAIRTRGFTLLVEGQFDLILLHQVGFTNTIALSGTALSGVHLSLIKRYADNLMLALDADRAGLSASAKNAYAALQAGMRVKAVRLPQGKDPADLVKDTPQDFKRRVGEAESIVEFFLSVLTGAERDPHRLVVAVERTVLPLVAVIKSPLEREHFVGIVARALGSSVEAVRASVPKHAQLPPPLEESTVSVADQGGKGIKETVQTTHERLIKATLLTYPDTPLAKRLTSEYSRIIGTLPKLDELPERVLFEVGLLFGEAPMVDSGDDLLHAFERAVLTERLDGAVVRLRLAESSKDETEVQQALRECKDLSGRLGLLG
jgi:DNA primase